MSTAPPLFSTLGTELPGLVILRPRCFRDARGIFVKTYHEKWFAEAGMPFVPREEFYSVSNQGVLRGMHFQRPPSAHAKLIYCLSGKVLDVVLDMRHASPTFGCFFSRELDVVTREALYIPAGLAHGFLSLEDNSLMVYKTDSVHAPECDAGIAWNSFGFPWPVDRPLLSDRDSAFPAWQDFESPF